MAFGKALGLAIPFEDFAGFFLKSFQQGTTTPINMATDATGGTLLAKAEVSSGGTVPIGFFQTAGGVIFLPHMNETYDSWLFPTEAEADANNTTNATQIADNLLVTVATSNGEIDSDVVSYDPGGGEDVTDVQARLRELDLEGSTHTTVAKTTFVSTVGSDTTGDGTVSLPFATVQRAWDSLPDIILHQQTIQLADGTYNSSNIAAAAQPRPAILWGKDKITTFRSTLVGTELEGPIVIKGNSSDQTAVDIVTTVDFTNGIYINKGNIALQDLSISGDNLNNSDALLTAHRTDTYIHCLNVLVDGIDNTKVTRGIIAESGGQIEFVGDGAVKNCGTNVETLTASDTITMNMVSGATNTSMIEGGATGVLARNNSNINLNSLQNGAGKVEFIANCTIGIKAITGANVNCRGNDGTTDMLQIASPIFLESGAIMELVFSETTSTVQADSGCQMKYNASNYQRNLSMQGSDLWLATSNSFVSPATVNTDARPVTLIEGARIHYTGTNIILGSANGYVSHNPGALAYTANNETKATVQGRNAYRISSDGATRLDCEIDSTSIEEGRVIFVHGDTNGVELIGTGTHMEFTNDFIIGGTVGQFTGATFMMRDSKWRLVGLGQLRA